MDTRHLTTSQQPGEQHNQVHYATLVSDTNTVMATVPSTHPDAMLCMAEEWTWWWRRRDHLARPSALLNPGAALIPPSSPPSLKQVPRVPGAALIPPSSRTPCTQARPLSPGCCPHPSLLSPMHSSKSPESQVLPSSLPPLGLHALTQVPRVPGAARMSRRRSIPRGWILYHGGWDTVVEIESFWLRIHFSCFNDVFSQLH